MMTNDDTVLADQTDYVGDPKWSLIFFDNIPNDISSPAKNTVFVHKEYLRVTPLTIKASPLNFNTILNDKTSSKSLNLTFINTQETLNGTGNLTQQKFKTQHTL